MKSEVRPVVIIQTNFLNEINHPSTIICPVTAKINNKTDISRIRIAKGNFGLYKNCDIMPDQIRAIDNSRMIKKIVLLSDELKLKLKENIGIVLDF